MCAKKLYLESCYGYFQKLLQVTSIVDDSVSLTISLKIHVLKLQKKEKQFQQTLMKKGNL